MLEVREMLMQDLDQVAALEAKIFSVPWSRKGFEESLKQENTFYLVGIKERSIVAYCGMLKVLDEADITNVAVAEDCRGMGYGRQMVKALLERGKYTGIRAFTLEVRKSNQAAIHIYETLGFLNEGIRRNYYEKPAEDAVIMWKRC